MDNISFSSVLRLDEITKIKFGSNAGLACMFKWSLLVVVFAVLFGTTAYSEPMGPLTVSLTRGEKSWPYRATRPNWPPRPMSK